jgi:hypothetical protein
MTRRGTKATTSNSKTTQTMKKYNNGDTPEEDSLEEDSLSVIMPLVSSIMSTTPLPPTGPLRSDGIRESDILLLLLAVSMATEKLCLCYFWAII